MGKGVKWETLDRAEGEPNGAVNVSHVDLTFQICQTAFSYK
jgi:hypothetical protein